MTTKYGLFSDPKYLSPGITYRKETRAPCNESISPPNIKIPACRSGKVNIWQQPTSADDYQGNDATFDKFKPLFEKEKYKHSSQIETGRSEPSWKAPSPMKKSSGAGDFHGTIQGTIEHIPSTGISESKEVKAAEAARGIYTAPGKKGSYGMNRTTISELRGSMGVVSEYEYKAEAYRSAHEIITQQNQTERAKRITELPFKPPGVCQKKVTGLGICGEYEYLPEGDGAAKKENSSSGKFETPFRPAGRRQKGVAGMISGFPEFIPQTFPPNSIPKTKQEDSSNPWKPASINKTDCVKSIFKMNV